MMRLLFRFSAGTLRPEGTGIEDQVGKDGVSTRCSSGSRERSPAVVDGV
jgi:hypothetical protein